MYRIRIVSELGGFGLHLNDYRETLIITEKEIRYKKEWDINKAKNKDRRPYVDPDSSECDYSWTVKRKPQRTEEKDWELLDFFLALNAMPKWDVCDGGILEYRFDIDGKNIVRDSIYYNAYDEMWEKLSIMLRKSVPFELPLPHYMESKEPEDE